jgi:hypothetical protein
MENGGTRYLTYRCVGSWWWLYWLYPTHFWMAASQSMLCSWWCGSGDASLTSAKCSPSAEASTCESRRSPASAAFAGLAGAAFSSSHFRAGSRRSWFRTSPECETSRCTMLVAACSPNGKQSARSGLRHTSASSLSA